MNNPSDSLDDEQYAATLIYIRALYRMSDRPGIQTILRKWDRWTVVQRWNYICHIEQLALQGFAWAQAVVATATQIRLTS